VPRSRTSGAQASRLRSSSTTGCARHRQSCDRSSSGRPSGCSSRPD
jgi:hypothetical protein